MTRNIIMLLPFLCILFLSAPGAMAECAKGESNSPLFGVALDGYPIQPERLTVIEKILGVLPQMVVFFLQWPGANEQAAAPFPGESLEAIWHAGAIPCLTWEPMYYMEGHEETVPYKAILDGTYDPYLARFAEQAAAWKKPFMMRFAHEMNIERYHWGTDKAGYGPNSPDIYKRMFRYVVKRFQEHGAHNVLWVFCPNAESVPDVSYDPEASWNRMEAYYPGDAFVDILGMDGYNWGTTQTLTRNGWNSHWRSFADVFKPAWKTLQGLGGDKPIFVFETASVDQGGDKTRWIKEAFAAGRAWGLNGIVWFQANKEYDWRINSGGRMVNLQDMAAPCSCTAHQRIRGMLHDQRSAH